MKLLTEVLLGLNIGLSFLDDFQNLMEDFLVLMHLWYNFYEDSISS